MPALALISKDPELYQELVSAMERTDWSVEWLGPEVLGDAELQQDVVVLDAAHPGAAAWKPMRGKPILLVVEGEYSEGLGLLASDFVFRPTRREPMLARLERLRARSPIGDLQDRYSEAFASMAMGIVVLDPDLEILTANPRSCEITGHREETIASQDIGHLLSSEDLPRVREALSQGQYPRGMTSISSGEMGRTSFAAPRSLR